MSLSQLNQFHKGFLNSQHHAVTLRYNHNVWRSFMQQDGSDYAIWGLINRASGASFVLQIEEENTDDACTEASLSAAIFEIYREKLAEKDPNITLVGQRGFVFKHIEFMSAHYAYHNPNYGPQVVQYAFNFHGNFTYTLILTWPEHESLESTLQIPLKHKLLLDGLHIDQGQSIFSKPRV